LTKAGASAGEARARVSIFEWIQKTHAYTFYVLSASFKKVYDDGWSDWKAGAVLSVGIFYALRTMANLALIAAGHRGFFGNYEPHTVKIFWIALGFCVAGVNVYAASKWARFEQEFERRPSSSRIRGGILVWTSLLLPVPLALWTESIVRNLPS
jgi:hypothetical protein